MDKKKIMVIALNLLLIALTFAGVGHAKSSGMLRSLDAPSATIEPDWGIKVSITVDKPDKYVPAGSKKSCFTMHAVVSGIPEGVKPEYQWYRIRDGKEKAIEDAGDETYAVKKVKDIGKIQYRCDVTFNQETVKSELFTKIGYKNQVSVSIGKSFAMKELFGISLKKEEGGQVKYQKAGKYAKCLSVSQAKETVLLKKYSKKMPSALTVKMGDGQELSITIVPKVPSAKEMKKDIRIKITNKKTRLTARFSNTAGISVINIQPDTLSASTIKKAEGKSSCTVIYNYKKKFKMKKFKVRYGYKPLGSKKCSYTKWVVLSA